MKNITLFTACLLVICTNAYAQVGIGTSSPNATLDINGTVRINQLDLETTENISLTGLTGGNYLNRTKIGANVVVLNNELTTAPVSRDIGDLNLGVEPIDSYVSGIPKINSLDLKITAGADNETATFINVHSYNLKYLLAGIDNGTEGRRVTLFFTNDGKNIKMLDDDSAAPAQDRILVLASSISTSGQGFIELVYDADAGSDSLGRWLVIKFRS